MKRMEIRNKKTNNRVFDALIDDDHSDKVTLAVKLRRNAAIEEIELDDVLQQIEKGKR